MMRDSSGGDFTVTVVPVTRSMIFWEASEVCKWLEALQLGAQVWVRLGERERSICTAVAVRESMHLGVYLPRMETH